MAICKLDRARPPELCAQNVVYITREAATDSIDFHNLKDLDVGDLEERRAAAIAYAETRELDAAANQRIKNSTPKIDPQTGKAKPTRQDRNHSTLILSWDRTENTDKVREMTKAFLEKEFKTARCIYTIHTDKVGQTHAHVWVDNKLETGKKLQISQKQFYSLDERWAQRYDERYSTDYAPRFKELKIETLEWKKEKAIATERGEEFTKPKPLRYGDFIKANLKEKMRARELQNIGEIEHDEERNNRSKQLVTVGYSAIEESQRSVEQSKLAIADNQRSRESSKQTVDRTEQAVGETVRAVDESLTRSNQLPNRTRSVERDDDRGR